MTSQVSVHRRQPLYPLHRNSIVHKVRCQPTNSSVTMNARPYQVVVWGTTGVVGRLVAEHIARDYQVSADIYCWFRHENSGGRNDLYRADAVSSLSPRSWQASIAHDTKLYIALKVEFVRIVDVVERAGYCVHAATQAGAVRMQIRRSWVQLGYL